MIFPCVRDINIEGININIDIDSDDEIIIRIPKRYIRDGQDSFEIYSNVEFKKRYRFDKNNVKYRILPKIEQGLIKTNNRGLMILPIIQLLICLRFYATASFQVIMFNKHYQYFV